MLARSLQFGLVLLYAGSFYVANLDGRQDPPPADLPAVPKGVEVLARGPVHEAYASLVGDPTPTKPIAKQPPKQLDEMPPAEKPEGNVTWISGYWAFDEDRNDFLWVSGTWRSPPPGKQWVAGYWRETNDNWQWVAGFWTVAAKEDAPQDVTYLPEPPPPPAEAAPGKPPAEESFYVPGAYIWTGNRYQWRAGYWAKVQSGYVWVPDDFRWTPNGCIFIPGYWDHAVSRRGVLYAPVYVDPVVVTTSFYYTPAYAVHDTIVVDSLWVRPAYCHYYFGDYYEPVYRERGFESGIVYSRTRYDSIVVYERYDRVYVRRQPDWEVLQINIYNDRVAGRADRPPRTLVEQNNYIQQKTVNSNNTTNVNNNATVINNYTMLAPPAQVMAAKGQKSVTLDAETRQQAKQQAVAVQQVAMERTKTEVPSPGGPPRQPRVASLTVPKAQPVTPGFVAPKPLLQQAAKVSAPAAPATGNVAKSTPGATTPAVQQGVSKSSAAPGVQPANHLTTTPGKTGANPTNPVAAPTVQQSTGTPTKSSVPNSTTPGLNTPPTPRPGSSPGTGGPGMLPTGPGNPAGKQAPPPPSKRPPPPPPPKREKDKDKDQK